MCLLGSVWTKAIVIFSSAGLAYSECVAGEAGSHLLPPCLEEMYIHGSQNLLPKEERKRKCGGKERADWRVGAEASISSGQWGNIWHTDVRKSSLQAYSCVCVCVHT